MNLDLNTIHFSATQVALWLGFLVPVVTAIFVKINASGPVKSVVAGITAGLAAVLSGVLSVSGEVTLKQLLISFVVAGVSAGATRKWLTEDIVNWFAKVTAKFGIGGTG